MTDQMALFEEMVDAERDAIAADFMGRHAEAAVTGTAPRPCVCEHPMVFAGELGEGRCGLCGREPREDIRSSNGDGHDERRSP